MGHLLYDKYKFLKGEFSRKMNKLKITLNKDGSIGNFAPDFKIMRGSYRNILINIEVPRSLLLELATNESGEYVTGNNVRIAGIINTVLGQNIQTKRYELKWVKDYTVNNVEYSLYQRKMPKEFTLWETNNQMEQTMGGKLNMVINVTNWAKQDSGVKMEEVASSSRLPLAIYPGAFLENAEEIEDPSDFDQLYSQVQDIHKDYTTFKNEYQEWIDNWYLKQKANFDKMKEDLLNDFDSKFKKLDKRMNTVERDSLIRIDGEKISESDLIAKVQILPDGLYIANTEQFDDEIILISGNNEFIARYTGTGASYNLDKEIGDWVMSAGGGGGGGSGGGNPSTQTRGPVWNKAASGLRRSHIRSPARRFLLS